MTDSPGISLEDFVTTQVVKARAAELLGIRPSTLQYLLNKDSGQVYVRMEGGEWHYRTISEWTRGGR